MTLDLRARVEVWLNAGHRDGYDGNFRPPKHANKDLIPAYLAGWAAGTADAIIDAQERQEKRI